MKIKVLFIIMFLFTIPFFSSCSMQKSKNSNEEQFLTSIPIVSISPSPVLSDFPDETVVPTSSAGDRDKEYSNNYDKYNGKWFDSHNAKNYDITWSEGGCILDITEIKDNYIKGYYAVIQEPPANRIADFDFEGYIEDSKLTFDFEDGFCNTGNATIEFKESSIEVKINDLEISEDNSSGWCVCDAIFSIENNDDSDDSAHLELYDEFDMYNSSSDYFKGFILSEVWIGGEPYYQLFNEEKDVKIIVDESQENAVIYHNGKSMDYYMDFMFSTGTTYAKIELCDVTGDDKDDLIIYHLYGGTGISDKYCNVIDLSTMSECKIENYFDELILKIKIEPIKVDENNNLVFRLTDAKGKVRYGIIECVEGVSSSELDDYSSIYKYIIPVVENADCEKNCINVNIYFYFIDTIYLYGSIGSELFYNTKTNTFELSDDFNVGVNEIDYNDSLNNSDTKEKETISPEASVTPEANDNANVPVITNIPDTDVSNIEPFYGEWVISKVLASNPISAFSTEEAMKLVGISMIYNREMVSYNGTEHKNPCYKQELLSKAENDDSSYVTFEDLGIDGDSVLSVEIYEDYEYKIPWVTEGSYFLVKDNDTLILTTDGEYFELTRKR